MPKDDFYTPTDADELRMENELLAYEVRFLRAMMADPLGQIEDHRTRLQHSRQELDRIREENAFLRERRQQLQHQNEHLEKLNEYLEKLNEHLEEQNERLEGARSDLIRLLESMSGGAMEIAHRRNEVFAELKERYL